MNQFNMSWKKIISRANRAGAFRQTRASWSLRVKHKNSSKLLRIATSLCLYLSLASIYIVSVACFTAKIFSQQKGKKMLKRNKTQIVMVFFSLMMKKYRTKTTLQMLITPWGVRLVGQVAKFRLCSGKYCSFFIHIYIYI